jgi:restriction system protein
MLAPDPRFAAIDAMSGKDFELALVDLFRLLGFADVQRTPRFDKGADLIVVDNGDRIAVQAKRASNAVRIDAVRQLIDGIRRYECTRGLLVTNSFFTQQAIECAREWGIELWDRNTLAQCVDGEASPVDTTVCAECGVRVTQGVTDWCLGHPAVYGGAVYCIRHQRRPRAQ